MQDILILRNRIVIAAEDAAMAETCEHIADCLREQGYRPRQAVINSLGEAEVLLQRKRPDAVFTMVEALQDCDANAFLVLGLMRMLNIPYTGCPPEAFVISCDKILAKQLLRANRIPTPPSLGDETGYSGRYLVKSITEHASLGIDQKSVVASAQEAELVMMQKQKGYGGRWFAEAYIHGREVNVSMVEQSDGSVKVLPIAEIVFVDYPDSMARILDHEAKWKTESFAYHNTQRRYLDAADPLIPTLERMAMQCWHAFGMRGFARVDFRIDAQGNPLAIDVNANPCLGNESGFIAAIRQSGGSDRKIFADLLRVAHV